MTKRPGIVSLLPSSTEMICELGMQDQLLGISHCCDYPSAVTHLPRVTNTLVDSSAPGQAIDSQVTQLLQQQSALYSLDQALLDKLAPDMIVTQAVCDVCAVSGTDVVELAQCLPGDPAIVNLEPFTLAQVLDTVQLVANAGGASARGTELVRQLETRIQNVVATSQKIEAAQRPRVLCIDWCAPPFVSGHWVPEMIEMAGGIAVPGATGEASFRTTWQQVFDWNPDVLFIALCGMKLERTRREIRENLAPTEWPEARCVQDKRIYYTDGNALFNRPSHRLVDSLELLAHCLHPQLFAAPPLPLFNMFESE